METHEAQKPLSSLSFLLLEPTLVLSQVGIQGSQDWTAAGSILSTWGHIQHGLVQKSIGTLACGKTPLSCRSCPLKVVVAKLSWASKGTEDFLNIQILRLIGVINSESSGARLWNLYFKYRHTCSTH